MSRIIVVRNLRVLKRNFSILIFRVANDCIHTQKHFFWAKTENIQLTEFSVRNWMSQIECFGSKNCFRFEQTNSYCKVLKVELMSKYKTLKFDYKLILLKVKAGKVYIFILTLEFFHFPLITKWTWIWAKILPHWRPSKRFFAKRCSKFSAKCLSANVKYWFPNNAKFKK